VIDLRKEAEKVIDKLLSGTIQQLAVFVTPDGRVKTTKPTTDLFAQAVKKIPNSLVGVYTAKAFPADLANDIRLSLEAQGVYLSSNAS